MIASDWLQELTEASTDAERAAIVQAMSLATLSPELREALEAAAVPHWFDASFLDALLGEESDLHYDQLLAMSFVELAPGRGYAVHERTRKQLLDDLWQKEPERFHLLSAIAAGYCAEQAEQTEDDGWEAEEIYHLLVSDPDAGVDGLRALATRWANYEYHTYDEIEFTVRLAEEQIAAGRLSGAGEAWTRLWQARLALIFGRPDLAPAALDQIILDPDGDFVLAAEVAQTRGDMLAQLGDEEGMEAAWREAYERYSQMADGGGQLDAFLVAERMRGAGLPDPEAATAVATTPTPPGKDALQLIDNIEYAWIEGVLETSVDETLKLHMAHGGELTSNLVFHNPQGIDRPVSSGRLSRLFAAADGSMLVLGAPGSGKTITLLQLLEELLNEARLDSRAPIPLLFNLSSFGAYTQENDADLTGWVADQAYKQYRLKRETTREQLAAGTDLTLLLDGLDEVPLEERETCVEAINQFVDTYPCELVVCSRIGDYQVLNNQLALNHALVLQPLSNGQIAAVIDEQVEPERTVMQEQIQSDWQLREALRSPLLLSLYPQAFPALNSSGWSPTDTVEERRQSLFAAFVDTVFTPTESTDSAPDITPKEGEGTFKSQCQGWLAFLATKMQAAGTTLFYVEDLQPHWLPKRLIRRYRGLYGLILGLFLGLITWLSSILISILISVSMLESGLILGLGTLIAIVVAVLFTNRVKRPWLQFTIGATVSGLIVTLFLGLESWVNFSGDEFLLFDMSNGLVSGLGIIISSGIASIGVEIQLREKVKILRPSRQQILTYGKRGGLYGITFGLIFGLIYGLVSGLDNADLNFGLLFGLVLGLIFGLVFGLILGIVLAFLDTPLVDERPYPGQGVRASFSNAFRWSTLVALFIGSLFWFIERNVGELSFIDLGQVLVGTLLLSFTWFGGMAWSRHMALRIVLSRNNWLPRPRQLVPWLDEMAALGLLRRVGGGYIFIHRSLLEYFAALQETPNM